MEPIFLFISVRRYLSIFLEQFTTDRLYHIRNHIQRFFAFLEIQSLTAFIYVQFVVEIVLSVDMTYFYTSETASDKD